MGPLTSKAVGLSLKQQLVSPNPFVLGLFLLALSLSQQLSADILAVNVGNYSSAEGKVQVNCELVGAGPLRYPPKARRFRYTGQVIVGFSVAQDGSVSGAHIVDAEPPGIFERSALSHIRTWKYNPPEHNGENVQVDDVFVRLVFQPDR
ncbi:MAG: hypothetical protein CBD27_01065 [Rhodospirillaceae bacterium TMED167]|nr:MAG: hypothetical protein CBD27_01065 [Rhodospirillaceae bacterium TMED167]